MKAMILAAGLGTRLRPYTDILAKPAIPFLNIPLLYYSIALIKSAKSISLDECILNSHHQPEQIQKLATELEKKMALKSRITFEKEKPLGSGGGVWFARKFLKTETDFLVVNGDEVILPTNLDVLDQMLAQHHRSGALATLLVKRDPRVGSQFGGVWANSDREVFGFGKTNPTVHTGLEAFHYVGLMIMNSRALKYFPEGESNILYDAILRSRIGGEKTEIFINDCRWFETGNIKDFLSATDAILNEIEKNPKDIFLNHVLKSFAPESSLTQYQNSRLFRDRSASIHPEAKLNGFVVLGANVEVPSGCELHNVVVNENLKLKSQTYSNDLILAI